MNEAKGFTEPSTKSFPFLQGSILLGVDTRTTVATDDVMEFTFYQRQMNRIMKSLETVTEFGNMTTSAQLSILKNRADKHTAFNYSFELYHRWLKLEEKTRTAEEEKEMEQLAEKLRLIENKISAEYAVQLRQIGRLKTTADFYKSKMIASVEQELYARASEQVGMLAVYVTGSGLEEAKEELR